MSDCIHDPRQRAWYGKVSCRLFFSLYVNKFSRHQILNIFYSTEERDSILCSMLMRHSESHIIKLCNHNHWSTKRNFKQLLMVTSSHSFLSGSKMSHLGYTLSPLTARLSLGLLLAGCTIPLISPMCPEPMAKSLSFQSFDNSLSMLGASV